MKTTTSPAQPVRYQDLPKDYTGLCQILLPRPIHGRADCREATAMTDALAGHRLTKDQEDYFDLLCGLIEDYEAVPPPQTTGLETLRHLMEGRGMTGVDLAGVLDITRSQASRLLSGERQLTRDHIAALAGHFEVSPAVLF